MYSVKMCVHTKKGNTMINKDKYLNMFIDLKQNGFQSVIVNSFCKFLSIENVG